MSWLAVLLVGVAVADLGHSVRPVRHLPEAVGAVAAVALGLLAGLTGWPDLLALAVVAAVVVMWGRTVRVGFGRGRAWLPLTLLGTAVLVALLCAPLADDAAGAVGRWLDATGSERLAGVDPDHALLVLAVVLLQCSTGNVLVRLVLAATGTVNPSRGPAHDATRTLKGGRLLGPMERLVILGLGLAGQVTAASLVIAAKGLIRWPELRSIEPGEGHPTINEVTEYFLVGSFVSWLVPLASLVLVAA